MPNLAPIGQGGVVTGAPNFYFRQNAVFAPQHELFYPPITSLSLLIFLSSLPFPFLSSLPFPPIPYLPLPVPLPSLPFPVSPLSFLPFPFLFPPLSFPSLLSSLLLFPLFSSTTSPSFYFFFTFYSNPSRQFPSIQFPPLPLLLSSPSLSYLSIPPVPFQNLNSGYIILWRNFAAHGRQMCTH